MATDLVTEKLGGMGPGEVVLPRKSRPVVWWAVLGLMCTAVGLYAQGAWIISGDAARIHPGVTPVPTSMEIAATVNQLIYLVAVPFMLYWFVYRAWRRTGRVGFEGYLCGAMWAVWWMDPAFNYLQTTAMYNSTMFNLGSWTGHIPGAVATNARQVAEPLPWSIGFYRVLVPVMILGCCAVMRKARARWPQASDATLLAGAAGIVALGDLVLEGAWTHLGLYTYAGIVPGWALWEGHHYQFPIYEPILVGISGIAFVSFGWFRNDKGETLAERGLDGLRASRNVKGLVRFFAVAGAMGTIYFSYNLAISLVQLHADRFPADVQQRSYFMNGLCGAGTEYACPGKDVAMPKKQSSIHVAPDGSVVVPEGTPPLKTIPLKRTE